MIIAPSPIDVNINGLILARNKDEGRHIRDALKAHFPEERAPAATWIGVRALADAAFLIEVEATAVIE